MPALTDDAAVSALQRGGRAGDGAVGAVLGGDAGADGRQGGAGAAGGWRGRAAGQRGAGADALRHRRALKNGNREHITHRRRSPRGGVGWGWGGKSFCSSRLRICVVR